MQKIKKERPILFSTEMVQAILNGRKTMTRRIIKPQPIVKKNGWFHWGTKYSCSPTADKNLVMPDDCPYGKIGDILYVKETYLHRSGAYEYKASPGVFMKTQNIGPTLMITKWKPSLFMPKSAARIFLEITDIKVERLNDISEEDSIREGVEVYKKNYCLAGSGVTYKKYGKIEDCIAYSQARNSFRSLWKLINGEQSWNDNPWVWVIEFKRINK